MAQKVYLNNEDKLIIETDNGRIDAENNQTTELKGKFEIEANDLARIAAVLNDATFEITWNRYSIGYALTTNDDALNKMKKYIDKLMIEKRRLIELIDNHNDKCIFKFRKINY